MDDTKVWSAVDQRRRAIVDLLTGLTPDEWNTPSLLVGHHRTFPGLTCRESLIDAVGHTFDMAIPLGREIRVPAAEVAEAADRIVSYRSRGNAKVFRSLPLATFRLTATDHAWSTGDGMQVTGTMTDLFLLLAGRTVRIGQLHGPGADDLRRAVAT